MEVRAEPHGDADPTLPISLPSTEKRGHSPRRAVSAHSQAPSARPPSPGYPTSANGVKAASGSAPSSRSKEIFANRYRGDVLALADIFAAKYQTSGQAKERLTLSPIRSPKNSPRIRGVALASDGR